MFSTFATTLALKVIGISPMGVNIVGCIVCVLAQGTDVRPPMSGAFVVLDYAGSVLAYGGLLFAALMFMMGQTQRMVYGLLAALIGGLAFPVAKALFHGAATEVHSQTPSPAP